VSVLPLLALFFFEIIIIFSNRNTRLFDEEKRLSMMVRSPWCSSDPCSTKLPWMKNCHCLNIRCNHWSHDPIWFTDHIIAYDNIADHMMLELIMWCYHESYDAITDHIMLPLITWCYHWSHEWSHDAITDHTMLTSKPFKFSTANKLSPWWIMKLVILWASYDQYNVHDVWWPWQQPSGHHILL